MLLAGCLISSMCAFTLETHLSSALTLGMLEPEGASGPFSLALSLGRPHRHFWGLDWDLGLLPPIPCVFATEMLTGKHQREELFAEGGCEVGVWRG